MKKKHYILCILLLAIFTNLTGCGSGSNEKNADTSLKGINFSVSNVRDDNTGRWRISTIAESIQFYDVYGFDYYDLYFENDDEIHFIVNFTYNTTSQISKFSNILGVTVREYVDGEEHDANKLGSGMVLGEYHLNLADKTVEKIR